MDKKEIKQLLTDSKHIQIPEDIEKAEMEGKELSQLLEHGNSEEAELKKIDQQIEKELGELKKMLGEDETILQEMENCLHYLENLETIMQNEKSTLEFMSDKSSAKTVLKDIDTTRNKLQSELQQEENITDKLENQFSSLKKNAPKGKAVAGTAARASISTLKLVLISVIILVALTWFYI